MGTKGLKTESTHLELKNETILDRVFIYIMVFLFTSSIVVISLQVLVRNFNIRMFGSLSWTIAVGRLCLIIGTFYGAAVATRNSEHIKIEFIIDFFNRNYPIGGKILQLLSNILNIIFLGIVIYAFGMSIFSDWNSSFAGGVITTGQLFLLLFIGVFGMIFYEFGIVKKCITSIYADFQRDN